MAGWHSVLGYRAYPTIIPDSEVPIGKPPFEYGYEQARAFALPCARRHASFSRHYRSGMFSWADEQGPVPATISKFNPHPWLSNFGLDQPEVRRLHPARTT